MRRMRSVTNRLLIDAMETWFAGLRVESVYARLLTAAAGC